MNQYKSNPFEVTDEFQYRIRELFDTKVDFEKYEVDKHAIYIIPTSRTKAYTKKVIQIHHRCYRDGIMYWEQPLEDTITLCNICHHLVHEQQLITLLTKDGSFTVGW